MIYDVNATDADGDNITYLISVNSENSRRFRVENDTGRVFTRPGVILDREVGLSSCKTSVPHAIAS